MREKILEKILPLFLREGFSKVNTDTIAYEVGISKRTLYKYFPTKDLLVDAVTTKFQSEIKKQFDKTLENIEDSPLEKLREILFFLSETSSNLSKKFLQDVKDYRPDIFLKATSFRKERIKSLVVLIKEGQKKKKIKKEIDPDLAVDILLSAVDGVINPNYLTNSKHSAQTAMNSLINIFLNGILAKKNQHIQK